MDVNDWMDQNDYWLLVIGGWKNVKNAENASQLSTVYFTTCFLI